MESFNSKCQVDPEVAGLQSEHQSELRERDPARSTARPTLGKNDNDQRHLLLEIGMTSTANKQSLPCRGAPLQRRIWRHLYRLRRLFGIKRFKRGTVKEWKLRSTSKQAELVHRYGTSRGSKGSTAKPRAQVQSSSRRAESSDRQHVCPLFIKNSFSAMVLSDFSSVWLKP